MKLLFISEYYYPAGKGGGEISCKNLAEELVKNGVEIHVLTSHFDGLKKKEEINGVVIHRRLKTGKSATNLFELGKRIFFFKKTLKSELNSLHEKENFDIIHCFNITSIYAIEAKEKIKKPFILHVNSPVLFCPKGTLVYKDQKECNLQCTLKEYSGCYKKSTIFGKISSKGFLKYNPIFFIYLRKRYLQMKRLMFRFDYFFAISKYVEKKLIERGVKKENISVVYNIIHLEKFKDAAKYRKKNKIPKILYVGEYSKIKGPQILLDALNRLKIPFEANFYGSGVLEKEMKEFVIKNHLNNVHIHGFVEHDDLPKIMAQHDLLVVPSLFQEFFGRVTIEALSTNTSILASNSGALPEIIIKKNIFDVNDSKEISNLILKKITNNRKEIISIDSFNKIKIIRKVLKLYNKLS